MNQLLKQNRARIDELFLLYKHRMSIIIKHIFWFSLSKQKLYTSWTPWAIVPEHNLNLNKMTKKWSQGRSLMIYTLNAATKLSLTQSSSPQWGTQLFIRPGRQTARGASCCLTHHCSTLSLHPCQGSGQGCWPLVC